MCVNMFQRVLWQAGTVKMRREGAKGRGLPRDTDIVVLVQQKKDLIHSGWQVGVWLVELISAVFRLDSFFLG